ncbi:uncharacterized protein ACIB01_007940 [Guaruba guarouba]
MCTHQPLVGCVSRDGGCSYVGLRGRSRWHQPSKTNKIEGIGPSECWLFFIKSKFSVRCYVACNTGSRNVGAIKGSALLRQGDFQTSTVRCINNKQILTKMTSRAVKVERKMEEKGTKPQQNFYKCGIRHGSD